MRLTIGSDVTMDFFYNQNGQPFAVNYNGRQLYYVLNQQGDVVKVVNASGDSYGIYTYDAWGNILYCTDNQWMNNNPLRYRGYVYDVECNLYYLQSRYYDPEMGRFINADTFASTGQGLLGNNMFAYCGNNPVLRSDVAGNAWETAFDVASLILSAVEVAANPTDLTAWAGLVGDAVDLLPFVAGVGETIRALRTADKIADGADIAIDTYRNLKKVSRGTGNEVHHILEKRFVKQLDLDIDNTNDMYSIILSKEDHRSYTNAWRALLPYGSTHDMQNVLKAGAQLYHNNPRLMGAFLLTLENLN